ncbi:MAG: M15 family metallopeptidase, partial [Mailhella sp.]|nr:M15 family metallopeptidase [Mailhella sp.]
ADPAVETAPLPAAALLASECLREAYPGLFRSMERSADGRIWLVTSAGERLLYDDGRAKTFDQMMEDADIEDTLRMPYPLEPDRPVPPKDFDPGRVRSYPLLKALYGTDRAAAERNSTRATLGGRKLRVAKRITAPLAKVDAEYVRLLAENAALRPYLQGDVDCMCWRVIARTSLLSAHSWGTAIDLNPKMGTYWQWSKKMPHPQQFSFPPELVRPFEENGFIWGGKWQHYDMMHFEYRPEIIIKAKKLKR